MTKEKSTPANEVRAVLQRNSPSRIVYAPNYWQWFTHHQNHGLLPEEIAHCTSQWEMIRHLGLDGFSRNVYCDPAACWFGGLSGPVWDGVEVEVRRRTEGRDTVTEKVYHTKAGELTERLRFVFDESTLVQEKYLLDDYASQMDAFEEVVRARTWCFDRKKFSDVRDTMGDGGIVNAGELFSPLKLLHLAAGAADAVFLMEDFPERCKELMREHEEAQLQLVGQMLEGGVESMIAMDNLDSMFHSPRAIGDCSAGYYERVSGKCHEAGATFFIHACGRQKAILPLIASLGVDGLEGVAFSPLGDVELDEAMRLTGDRFIMTGGISAMETERFQSREEVSRYVGSLLGRMLPYGNRFMLSASCNTSIRTPWPVIVWFRDAWREFGS